MADNWDDLLQRHPDVDPGKMIAYLKGELSVKERYEVERLMAESDFMSDAMEGLARLKDKGSIEPIVGELNRALHLKISTQSGNRKSTPAGFPSWLVVATILIVVLAVLGYVVYRMYTTP